MLNNIANKFQFAETCFHDAATFYDIFDGYFSNPGFVCEFNFFLNIMEQFTCSCWS